MGQKHRRMFYLTPTVIPILKLDKSLEISSLPLSLNRQIPVVFPSAVDKIHISFQWIRPGNAFYF